MLVAILDLTNYIFNPNAVPVFITAALLFLLGIWILLTSRNFAVGLSFFLLTFLSSLWMFIFSGMYCATSPEVALHWARSAYLFLPFIPSSLYLFSVLLLGTYPRVKKSVGLAFVFAFIFVALATGTNALIAGVTHYSWGYYPRYGWLAFPYLVYFFGVIFETLRSYWMRYKYSPEGMSKQRIRSFLIGFAVASLASVDYLAKFGIPIYPWGFAPTLLFIGIFIGTLWRYQLAERTVSEGIDKEIHRATSVWVLLAMSVAALIISLDFYATRVASRAIKELVLAQNQSSASMMGQLVEHNLERSVSLAAINQWLRRHQAGQKNSVFILDNTGSLVAHPRLNLETRFQDEYKKVPEVQVALRGNMSMAEYIDPIGNEKMIATFYPIPVGEKFWVAVAQQPAATAYAPIRQAIFYLNLGGCLIALLAFVVVGFLARILEKHRRLNQLFASIVESSDDAIFSKGLDGTILSWNHGAERLYGYTAQEVLNKSASMLLPPENETELTNTLARLRKGETISSYESERVRKDGTRFYASLTISPIHDVTGKVSGASVVAKDITEWKRAEEILQQKNQQLELLAEKIKEEKDKLQRFHNVTVDRELEMKKMKQEVNELLEKLGKAPRYKKWSS